MLYDLEVESIGDDRRHEQTSQIRGQSPGGVGVSDTLGTCCSTGVTVSLVEGEVVMRNDGRHRAPGPTGVESQERRQPQRVLATKVAALGSTHALD